MTPSGTRTRLTRSPDGRTEDATTSPTGSGKPATSRTLPTVTDAATDTTTVSRVVGVTLEQDRSRTGEAGTIVTYTHSLVNTGNDVDTFDLSHVSSQGWTVTYDTPVVLNAWEETTVVVSVTVPADAVNNTVDSTTVTATSRANPGESDTTTDTTTVGLVAGVTLEPDRSGDGKWGRVVTYTHSLVNTGSDTDTFTLSHVSSEGWTVTYEPLVTLAPGEETTVVVSVTVPLWIPGGTVDTTVITATSQTAPDVFATVTDTTTAQIGWRLYLPFAARH